MNEIVNQLFDIGAIKFGSFVLKSGITSPIYIDLRESISFPHLLKAIGDAMWKKVSACKFDRLCGVPYTALPIASYLSIEHNLPMVMRRKEQKEHGTKKIIEGVYQKGQVCLILEDLITSGTSIMETIGPLEEVGLKVQDVGVFLDREQGGKERLTAKNLRVHSVTTLSEMLDIFHKSGRLDSKTRDSVLEFVRTAKHA
jgi:uridine monophosphate synthetase